MPGVSRVEAKPTEDGRLMLRFQDGSFKDPFIARYVSDGTIKMFAYLVLLYDPRPHPLLAIEEPENQLYPELLHELVEEFRDYARRGGQVFVSTHSPDFLNGAQLSEIYWLVKKDGFTRVCRRVTANCFGTWSQRAICRVHFGSKGCSKGPSAMSRVVFLLEEYSMKVLLEGLLPRLFPGLLFLCVSHEGKQDLERSIPRKLKAWREPGVRFCVICDNDGGDCGALRNRLVRALQGRPTRGLPGPHCLPGTRGLVLWRSGHARRCFSARRSAPNGQQGTVSRSGWHRSASQGARRLGGGVPEGLRCAAHGAGARSREPFA